jgi:hypothetical protein
LGFGRRCLKSLKRLFAFARRTLFEFLVAGIGRRVLWPSVRSIQLKKRCPLVVGPSSPKVDAMCNRYSCRRLLEKFNHRRCCVVVVVAAVATAAVVVVCDVY